MKSRLPFILVIFAAFSCSQPSDVDEVSKEYFQKKNWETSQNPNPVFVATSFDKSLKPIDDLTHTEAEVMAKEFLLSKLKVSAPADVDYLNADWIKLKPNFYKISSIVNMVDSTGSKKTFRCETKLKYKSGSYSDINNWSLVDIKLDK